MLMAINNNISHIIVIIVAEARKDRRKELYRIEYRVPLPPALFIITLSTTMSKS